MGIRENELPPTVVISTVREVHSFREVLRQRECPHLPMRFRLILYLSGQNAIHLYALARMHVTIELACIFVTGVNSRRNDGGCVRIANTTGRLR